MAKADVPKMKEEPIIQVAGLKVRYGSETILPGIDLEVRRGEFVSVVGKSGVGKSTLLYALARFIPSEGQICSPRHFGIVFQNYAVFPFLTVAGNVGLGLNEVSSEERDEIVHEYLELVELLPHADKYPAQLSGGQSQRVAIARALAARPAPEIIYCDEPFGALDIFTRDRMQGLLLKLWERKRITILFVTHSIEEAVFLSDRVLVMRDRLLIGEFHVPLERPRDAALKFSSSFVTMKKEILESMEPGLVPQDQ